MSTGKEKLGQSASGSKKDEQMDTGSSASGSVAKRADGKIKRFINRFKSKEPDPEPPAPRRRTSSVGTDQEETLATKKKGPKGLGARLGIESEPRSSPNF